MRMSVEQWVKTRPAGVTLLAGGRSITDIGPAQWVEACTAYCGEGNTLVCMEDLYGLEELFGVAAVSVDAGVPEDWVQWDGAPVADGLQCSFHFFGGVSVKPQTGGDDYAGLQTWGKLVRRNGAVKNYPAVGSKAIGGGAAVLFSVDLMHTFTRILQGISVVRDGNPAPDGTSAIDENILKTDDGCVLDWTRDRAAVAEGRLHSTCTRLWMNSHPFLSFDPGTGKEATKVVSLPTLSWDPPYRSRCTEQEALALTERALDVYGVAHFLFHPYMIADPQAPVGEMMVKLVEYGRLRGLEWWTSEQIWRWFEARRGIQVEWQAQKSGRSRFEPATSPARMMPFRLQLA